MSSRRRVVRSLTLPVALLLVATVAPVGAEPPDSASSLPPGCDTGRSAVAYHSDGSSADASGAPLVCAGKTGYGGAETRLVVGPNGDVAVAPATVNLGLLGTGLVDNTPGPKYQFKLANTTGIVISKDQGASWELVKPDDKYYQAGDHALYFDRTNGQLYFFSIFGAAPTPGVNAPQMQSQAVTSPGASSNYSTWYSTTMFGYVSENPRYTTAPAPAGHPEPVPGQSMSYLCANLTNLPFNNRTCHRSFDGGVTWQFASVLNSNPVPQHSECESATETSAYPQGDQTDGSVWALIHCGEQAYLARSTDEAATWPIVETLPFTASELRLDSAGNLYTMERTALADGGESVNALLLRTSNDDGRTWSEPLNLAHPDVRELKAAGTGDTSPIGLLFEALGPEGDAPSPIRYWWVAVGYEPGQVAVSYLTERPDPDGDGPAVGGFDGYLSVTRDAFDPNPVMYGATLNDPSAPMVTELGGVSHYVGVDIAPDGSPWAAFWSDCKNPDGSWADRSCAENQGQGWTNGPEPAHSTTVGRLYWP